MAYPKIVIISGKGRMVEFIYNSIKSVFEIEMVIVEENEPYALTMRRRKKKLGAFKIFGQHIFRLMIMPKLVKSSSKRIKQIIEQENLNGTLVPNEKLTYVSSVNSKESIALLQSINADIIIVNATRIIKKEVLNAVSAPFINAHSGITPKYGGNGGAYWALVNNDKKNCGVTIHLVEEGIDTGAIIFQSSIEVTKADNFYSYHFIQLAKEIELLKKTITAFINNEMKPYKIENIKPKLWYEPTIWAYLYNRIFKGIK